MNNKPYISQETANQLLDLLTDIMGSVDANNAISISKQTASYERMRELMAEASANQVYQGESLQGKKVRIETDEEGLDEEEKTGTVMYQTTLYVIEDEYGEANLFADMGDWAPAKVIQLDSIELISE